MSFHCRCKRVPHIQKAQTFGPNTSWEPWKKQRPSQKEIHLPNVDSGAIVSFREVSLGSSFHWQVLNPSPSVADHLVGKMAIQKTHLLLTKHQPNKAKCGACSIYFLNCWKFYLKDIRTTFTNMCYVFGFQFFFLVQPRKLKMYPSLKIVIFQLAMIVY